MNSNGRKNILIVDDDDGICTLLERILEKPDYQVITAPDGYTAMERLTQQKFDLVLTDWRMSDMDGLELAKVIQNVSPDTQILLMTGILTPELTNVIKSLGLTGWIKKPFTPSHILNMVEQVIG